MQYELSHHAAKRMQDRKIDASWLQLALDVPDLVEPDPIDRTAKHALKVIAAAGDRVLRVIYDDTANPLRIITVFFDRGMKGRV